MFFVQQALFNHLAKKEKHYKIWLFSKPISENHLTVTKRLCFDKPSLKFQISFFLFFWGGGPSLLTTKIQKSFETPIFKVFQQSKRDLIQFKAG